MFKKIATAVALALFCLIGNISISAQTSASLKVQTKKIRPLTVGDRMPDLTLKSMINYKGDFKISDFKGKVLIIDFFGLKCTSCFRELPKLKKLQEQFGDKLQIVLCTQDPKKDMEEFIRIHKAFANYNFPIITTDSILHKLFPFRAWPQNLWIDQGAKVAAITYSDQVNAENITKLLSGEEVHLPIKQDVFDYNVKEPLLTNGNGAIESSAIKRTLFTSHLPGMGDGEKRYIDTLNKIERNVFLNHSILYLYAKSLQKYFESRLVLLVKDSSRFFNFTDSQGWSRNNTFCYEINVSSKVPRTETYAMMKKDLDQFFRLKVSIQRRMMDCMELIRSGLSDSLLISKANESLSFEDDWETEKIFQNLPLKIFVDALNSKGILTGFSTIVIDGTNFTKPVDLRLKVSSIYNLPELSQALEKYGLRLVPAKREMEVLVIEDATE